MPENEIARATASGSSTAVRVYDYLVEHGPTGAQDIANGLGDELPHVRDALSNLKRSDRVYLTDEIAPHDNPNGRPPRKWAVVEGSQPPCLRAKPSLVATPAGKHKDHALWDQDLQNELMARYKAGDRKAGETLLANNTGLIHSQVKRYERGGVDKEDLLQAGMAGFFHGVSKFDPSQGARLSTYVTFWVRQYVRTEYRNNRTTIRVPICAQEDAARGGDKNNQRLDRARNAMAGAVSLDEPLNDGKPGSPVLTIGDVIADHTPMADDAQECEPADVAAAKIETAMAALDPRERKVIERRYLGDDATLKDVGAEIGVSRERARQLESRALEKMRRRMSTIEMSHRSRARSRDGRC